MKPKKDREDAPGSGAGGAAGDALARYRAKRSADRTPEPFGGEGGGLAPGAGPIEGGLFVVQKHAARRLHYDLRLEWAGVLKSWAVPKGPATDPKEKRLAVETEDHPLEYADFEGVIPAGEYGAGASIVWDRGLWRPLEDPVAGLAKGKLLFELTGYKLRGVWTLVKLKKGTKEWLLIRERRPGDAAPAALPEESVLSGLSVEELAEGPTRAAEVHAELERLGARGPSPRAADVDLMLAEHWPGPFSAEGWLFELKYDGFRLLAGREAGRPVLLFRRGGDATASFPEIVAALKALPFEDVVLDGEVVVLDPEGRPSFQRLQRRAELDRPREIARAAPALPATFFAFDLLAFGGLDVRPLPLAERKRLLRRVVPRTGPIRYAEHIEERGKDLYAEVRRLGLEGMVGKRADSPYRGGRQPTWRKVRERRTGDFVVVGWSEGKGARSGFGALHLACARGGGFVYIGKVGTGFSEKLLEETRRALDAIPRKDPPCSGPIPNERGSHWVEPRLVCEVRYTEITADGLLRQPAFLRFRTDKAPEECTVPVSAPVEAAHEAPASAKRKEVPLGNLKKVFWPDEGYTKGDLIAYYRAVAPWLLPYLRGRPLVLTRYPDGIAGKSFFQKNAPAWAPEWVRTVTIWSEDSQREIQYFVCDDVETLTYIANMGTIPLHIWASRVDDLERPDFTILDLDPKGAPFTDVVRLARAIRALCEEIDLPCFAKTSGSSGIHILVPLGAQLTFAEGRALADLLARIVVRDLPEIATMERVIAARGGRVYVDVFQNGHGKLIAAPLAVRPVPGATVSTPLAWSEVNETLDAKRFTIKTVPERLAARGDPLRPVLDLKPDLARSLARLAERVRGG